MSRNNFEAIEQKNYPSESVKSTLKKNVEGNVGVVRFVFNIIDLYIPKILDVFIAASKQKPNDSEATLNQGDPENNTGPDTSFFQEDNNISK